VRSGFVRCPSRADHFQVLNGWDGEVLSPFILFYLNFVLAVLLYGSLPMGNFGVAASLLQCLRCHAEEIGLASRLLVPMACRICLRYKAMTNRVGMCCCSEQTKIVLAVHVFY